MAVSEIYFVSAYTKLKKVKQEMNSLYAVAHSASKLRAPSQPVRRVRRLFYGNLKVALRIVATADRACEVAPHADVRANSARAVHEDDDWRCRSWLRDPQFAGDG